MIHDFPVQIVSFYLHTNFMASILRHIIQLLYIDYIVYWGCCNVLPQGHTVGELQKGR